MPLLILLLLLTGPAAAQKTMTADQMAVAAAHLACLKHRVSTPVADPTGRITSFAYSWDATVPAGCDATEAQWEDVQKALGQ